MQTGQPCKFPEVVVSVVLISACASTQITPRSGYTAAVPETIFSCHVPVPIPSEWSPPRVNAKCLLSKHDFTW